LSIKSGCAETLVTDKQRSYGIIQRRAILPDWVPPKLSFLVSKRIAMQRREIAAAHAGLILAIL
jgi:hypothetical protein